MRIAAGSKGLFAAVARAIWAVMTVLLWFKRDLRVQDHPALAQAAAMGQPVLPLYVVEPEYWSLPDTSARQWAFTAECLTSLQDELAALGAPLVLRVGQAEAVLGELIAAHRVTDVVSHEETGNGWTYARDLRVGAMLRGLGVRWHELPQSGVVRRLSSRDGWAARRERYMRSDKVEKIEFVQGVAARGESIPRVADLGLAAGPCAERQIGGRDEAEALLNSFLTERGQSYRRAMSSPLEGEWACSRISPYLALGVLSGREAAQATAKRKAEVKGTRAGWGGSLTSFTSRLAWRDHFMQKLEDEPELEHRCLHSAFEDLRPKAPELSRLKAWEKGETGIPFVDACMRALIATGWMNFRMRSMLVAVASYHLWLDWRATGPHLARMFTDYEPGIHWSQMQMQSGTTGMNTIRIYNPIKQGHDQDPEGIFTRRWLPELALVPDAFLQEPWRWEGAGRVLGRSYPAPIIDVKSAAQEARTRVWAQRKGAAFHAETAQLVQKHASRKEGPGGRHFVNDRAPQRRSKPTSGQLSFDL